ncbi:hypothetical protein QSJ19_03105 [Gordonia sp. ABSL11-1]|uniref:hypothetical protein n=1 Tax=Gordonia sp. ABSL11-1 TaxID=3053924 RepID=UPI0025733ED4|nr:hypothetical protein [Gordonia sp. ABSL11-1]MDL9944588.1 hypothetical protein [Gordonia sp. ABSL11-1]
MSDKQVDQLFKYMQTEFRKVHDSVGLLGERVDLLTVNLNEAEGRLGARMDKLEAKFDRVDDRFDRVDKRLDGLENRVTEIDDKLGEIQNAIGDEFNTVHGRLDRHETWIGQLASSTKVNLKPQP